MTAYEHTLLDWRMRRAREGDIAALEALIPLSARTLQTSHYTSAQIEAALGPIFVVDRQLIGDGSYFVVEHQGQILGCGGWGKRRSIFGQGSVGDLLDPQKDAARIRAFFVHPAWARRGIARSLLLATEKDLCAAHFRSSELVATLTGERLYASCGYAASKRYEINIPGKPSLPVVFMVKSFDS